MKWALIIDTQDEHGNELNRYVHEITDIDPTGRFHPSLVWVECGDEVTQQHHYSDDKGFYIPEPKPEPVIPQTPSAMDIFNNLFGGLI